MLILAKRDRVFPAYAGMFRFAAHKIVVYNGFPRIRGDVPAELDDLQAHGLFSPHTRGCSQHIDCFEDSDLVFPAYAGMFRAT